MDLRGIVKRQKLIQRADLRVAMAAEAIVHRHDHAGRNRSRNALCRCRIDGIIAAHRNEQRIAAPDCGQLRLVQRVSKVAAVYNGQSFGAQNVDDVPSAKRTLLVIVER